MYARPAFSASTCLSTSDVLSCGGCGSVGGRYGVTTNQPFAASHRAIQRTLHGFAPMPCMTPAAGALESGAGSGSGAKRSALYVVPDGLSTVIDCALDFAGFVSAVCCWSACAVHAGYVAWAGAAS